MDLEVLARRKRQMEGTYNTYATPESLWMFVSATNINDLVKCIKHGHRFVRATFKFHISGIKSGWAQQLADALKGNTTLLQLFMTRCALSDEEGCLILEALHGNQTLTKLDMIFNFLGAKSTLALAELVRQNRSIAEYHLYDNELTDEGMALVAENMKDNYIIMIFNIGLNELVQRPTARAIEYIVERNPKAQKKALREALNEKNGAKASWQRSKLMVVGKGRAGKTATVAALLGDKFNENWDSTVGIDVSNGKVNNTEWSKERGKLTNTDRFAQQAALQTLGGGAPPQVKVENTRKPKAATARPVGEELKTGFKNVLKEMHTLGGVELLTKQSSIAGSEIYDDNEGIQKYVDKGLLSKAYENRDTIRVSIWDYGGQKVFYTLHHLFLTRYGVYLVVFDMSNIIKPEEREDSLEYLQFWLNSIKMHAPECPVLLCGTFMDKINPQFHLDEIDTMFAELKLERYPQLVRSEGHCFHAINNRHRVGVPELKRVLDTTTRNQKYVDFQVSVTWMKCLDEMLEVEQGWLTMTEARKIALAHNVDGGRELNEMLDLMHELGVLIHFNNSVAVSDIVTTKPQWLVDEISKVIRDADLHPFDAEEIQKSKLEADVARLFDDALVSRDLMELLWDRKQVDFFVDLMRNLLLISEYKFGDTDNQLYLVPSMITRKELPDRPQGSSCVFDFSETFLPDGLFERLMCLCTQHSAHQGSSIEPILTQSNCQIWFGKESSLFFTRSKDRISVIVAENKAASSVLPALLSMVNKLRDEVMGEGLQWKVLLENAQGKLLAYEDAKKKNLLPWFGTAKDVKATDLTIDKFWAGV